MHSFLHWPIVRITVSKIHRTCFSKQLALENYQHSQLLDNYVIFLSKFQECTTNISHGHLCIQLHHFWNETVQLVGYTTLGTGRQSFTPDCMWKMPCCIHSQISAQLAPMYLVSAVTPKLHGWRRGSVVRTSVLGWQTFLIYGWHVTTSWVNCPLWVNQPGQLSLPSLQGQ